MASNRPIKYSDLTHMVAEKQLLHQLEDIPFRQNTIIRPRVGEGMKVVFSVVLYGAEIVTVMDDDLIIVNSNGVRTNTTKNRLNDFLIPLGWRVRVIGGAWKLFPDRRSADIRDFHDGMAVHALTD